MGELDDFSQKVADILDMKMRERGVSQNALAAESGVSQAQISRVLNHKRAVSVEDLFLLAAALGVSASEILGMAEESLVAPAHAPESDDYELAALDPQYDPELEQF